MKMLMIIYSESLEEEIRALLKNHKVRAFTEMHDVTGTGEAGGAFNSLAWPAYNNMILVALPESDAGAVVEGLKAFQEKHTRLQHGAKLPLRVFALPCELLV